MTEAVNKTYYITTPIYYVSGPPHVGSALTTISCDVLARYHRLRGEKTWFLTGTDENALKVQEAAEKAGVPVRDFVDGLAACYQDAWRQLGIANDDFIRTTEPRHARVCQEFVRRLQERGYVFLDTYEGWYSVSDETFFRDSEVKDGVAIESGKPVERVKEENYFFKLSAFGDRLLAHIDANPDFLLPEFRRNEVIGFIKEGLRDMSISRPNRGWGIPFPGDDSKVIYVWFDAVINYLTATGWPDSPDWERLWPADVHFMGKEIFVRFHATLWPAMLLALDLPLPKQVYGHGWWVDSEGKKEGKSTGGLPDPTKFTRLLAERSGASFELATDALRYLLCREMNYGLDVELTVENCLRRFNTDLANDLGNLVNRTVKMVGRYFGGQVPDAPAFDTEIVDLALRVREEYERAIKEFRLNLALEAAWKLVARMNKYVDEKAPWNLAKAAATGDPAGKEALARVLYTTLEAARVVSVLVEPFMPRAAAAMRAQLGVPTGNASWADLEWGGLNAGARLGEPEPLFPRIQELAVDDATLRSIGSTRASNAPSVPDTKEESAHVTEPNPIQTPPAPGTPLQPAAAEVAEIAPIAIDDFMKVELRVGEILAAEPVPNATKLLRLTVQAGPDDTRTILAGIAEFYAPEALVGRKVVVVANLLPRKMRGIESQGMLLAADSNGRAVLVQPEADAPVGARVR